MPYDPDDILRGMRPILLRYPEVAAAWLFGSAARGALRPDSDVDVGLVFRSPAARPIDHYAMLGDLAARLESVVPPHCIDLVVLGPHDPMFAHRVLVEGRLICEPDRERRIAFQAATVAQALDFAPTQALAMRGQAEGLRRRLRSGR